MLERDIAFKNVPVGWSEVLTDYRFRTLWMPLNQQNYTEYQQKEEGGRRDMLGRILTGNILKSFKGIGLYLPEDKRILVSMRPREERLTGFKDQLMTGITGGFTANVTLPDYIGLGKSVSRGYGAIEKE